MAHSSNRPAFRAAAWLLGLTAAAALFAAEMRDRLPGAFAADFMCWWTAAHLLAQGEDPYNPELQKQFQYAHGWRKDVEGSNIYDFVAFYHAPWLGLMCVPLTPLDYTTARAVFVAVNIEALVAGGWLLRRGFRYLPPAAAVVVPLLFGFSLCVLAVGQVTALVFLALAAAWRLLEAGWDRTAGVVLVVATLKPQLMVVPLAALIVWAAVRRRWALLVGLAVGSVLVFGGSCLFVPDWPLRMLQSQRTTPLPTDAAPGLGSTWFLCLKVFGLAGPTLGAAYLMAALPAFAWALWTASPRDDLLDLLCICCLVTPIVSPYGQPYDFVLMLLPLLRLADRPSIVWTGSLLLVYLAGPYLQFRWAGATTDHYLFFIVPASLTGLWLARGAANPSPAGGVSASWTPTSANIGN